MYMYMHTHQHMHTCAYTTAVSDEYLSNSDYLTEDFKSELLSLPPDFSHSPVKWIAFVRRWGRFLVRGGRFGGSLIVDMKYKPAPESSPEYAERALDSMFSSKSLESAGEGSSPPSPGIETAADQGGNAEVETQALRLLGSSEVSIMAHGGSPDICSAITDVLPDTRSTLYMHAFRRDLRAWLHSVPNYPRLADIYPQLISLPEVLPTGPISAYDMSLASAYAARASGNNRGANNNKPDANFATNWGEVRRALEQAILAMNANAVQGMDLQSAHCGCHGPTCLTPSSPPQFEWSDFNRLSEGECLSMQVRSSGEFSVALGNGGPDPFVFTVNERDVTLTYMSQKEAYTDSPFGVAFTDGALSARYFICLSRQNDAMRLEYGRGQYIVLTRKIREDPHTYGPPPSYFALSCASSASFESISVVSRDTLLQNGGVTRAPCGVPFCQAVDLDSENCVCKVRLYAFPHHELYYAFHELRFIKSCETHHELYYAYEYAHELYYEQNYITSFTHACMMQMCTRVLIAYRYECVHACLSFHHA